MNEFWGDPAEDAILADGPIANSCAGGHIATSFNIELPRWIVTVEYPSPDAGLVGVIVDVQEAEVARWFVVPKDDPLAVVALVRAPIGDQRLVIPAGRSMRTGRFLSEQVREGYLLPILDYLASGLRQAKAA